MNGFVTLLKEYQEKLHSEAELIQQQIANSNEISERQANYLDKLVESESRVADLADNVKKEADAAQQAVDMLSDHCKDQISGIVDAAKQDMDALAASTKVLTEASHSQMETLAQTAESEMHLLMGYARKDVERTKMNAKKFVRYQEGAEKYSLGLTKFQELAKEAKAVYKIDKVALVNCEIFERYLETFRIA